MLVIVGLSVLIGAAIAHAASARAAHPPTDNVRVRLSPSEVDRSVVPLPDHGRCGGVAPEERSLDWLPVDHGLDARRAAARMAFSKRTRDSRLEHQERADTAVRQR
jgi:hypothetical protein